MKNIKEGWVVKKLGEVCEIQTGKLDANAKVENGKYPFYTCDAKPYRIDTYAFDDEAILVSGNGSLVGHVNYYVGKFNAYQRTYVLTSFKSFNIQYLLLYLKGYLRQYIYSHRKGGCIPYITLPILKNFEIPCPPLSLQSRIVSELDGINSIIEKKREQLKELDALAQSIFYDMFPQSGGTSVKLSNACTVVSGLVNPNDEPYCNYPHVGGANIESNTGEFVDVKLAKDENLISGKYLFDSSMILYSKIRPNLNKVALPNFIGICSADMYAICPTIEYNRVFLKYVLSDKCFLDYAISHSGRANIPKINRADLLEYEFVSYPLSLQQSFAAKIEAIEKQKGLIKQSIAEVETLLASRMQFYFDA